MDFGQVQVMAISMVFAKKMMGFPVRIWSHFRTKPNGRQKGMGKYMSVIFFTGYALYLYYIFLCRNDIGWYVVQYIVE